MLRIVSAMLTLANRLTKSITVLHTAAVRMIHTLCTVRLTGEAKIFTNLYNFYYELLL